ncbi:MAG: right-handed parallel beta-helix repeat-containing protein [Pseudobdellovibrionaceae bacterium]|nr:right-handed parallel beta-helix repeat-containing protein [Bdellovibrionales bacterium]USN47550.1 MAG: right-handed parallel beta-helix repeat-containing protein [Pseudobdellovibrionaceae bacterium]
MRAATTTLIQATLRALTGLTALPLLFGCQLANNEINGSIKSPPQTPGSPSPVVPQLSYSGVPDYFVAGQNIASLTPTTNVVSGGIYSVSPPLPAGLVLNEVSGAISGAPTNAFSPTTFSLTLTHDGQTVTDSIELEAGLLFLVNTVNDTSDINPGDEICGDFSGDCSVRAAFEEGAALSDILVVVDVPAGNYDLPSNPLTISSRVIMNGAGPSQTIFDANPDASPIEHVFIIDAVAEATLRGFAAVNANIVNGTNFLGILYLGYGGGIYSQADTLNLENCDVSGHRDTPGTLTTTMGLGIYSAGSYLNVDNCTIDDNVSSLSAGVGFANGGAGIAHFGITHIRNSVISNNTMLNANDSTGGGLWLDAATIEDSQIFGNRARLHGAGINASSLTLINSQVFLNGGSGIVFGAGIRLGSGAVKNSAVYDNFGGDAEIYGVDGTIEVNNSTVFSNNTPFAIISDDAHFQILHSTLVTDVSVALNTSGTGSGTHTLGHSIVHAISGDSCGNASRVTSTGYNIINDLTCNFSSVGDVENIDPEVGVIANNGGPTSTMAISATSPARNAIPASNCNLSVDQRGEPRPMGGACDIGAFEYAE